MDRNSAITMRLILRPPDYRRCMEHLIRFVNTLPTGSPTLQSTIAFENVLIYD